VSVFVEPKVNQSKKIIMVVEVKSPNYGYFLYHSFFLYKLNIGEYIVSFKTSEFQSFKTPERIIF
jgi:hypothetical protein